jgi:CRP/FNR family transcriptional regulator, nitrogen oxide reductase regulator
MACLEWWGQSCFFVSPKDLMVTMPPIDRGVIKEFGLFSALDDQALDDILGGATSRLFTQDDAVFQQGGNADRFFVLLSGRLKVSQITVDGQQIIVRVINPGDLFGIAKALRRNDYPGTATAVLDSLVLCWPMNFWDVYTQKYPPFALNAMQTMGNRLQEAHKRVQELATEEVERRVAHAVLRLVQQSGVKETKGVRIDFPVSRQDIAEMTGTTLHTVSRILSAWEAAGLVIGGRQKLLVREPHKLLLIADGHAPGHL